MEAKPHAKRESIRMSITSSGPAMVTGQRKIRAPLAAYIIIVVTFMTALVGVVVGMLTINKSKESIMDITSQLRASIADQTTATVKGTLFDAKNALQAKITDMTLTQFVNNDTDPKWLSRPDIVALFFSGGSSVKFFEGMAMYFFNADSTREASLIVSPRRKMVYYQNSETNFILLQRDVLAINKDYGVQLSPNTTITISDYRPSLLFGSTISLFSNSAQPAFSTLNYAEPLGTYVMNLLWPVWKGLPILTKGPGPFYACYSVFFTLETINNFFQSLRVSPTGLVALVERGTGLMIASSVPGISQNGTQDYRFPAIGNPNGLVSSAASYLANTFGNGTLKSIPVTNRTYDLSFRSGGDDILVNAAWIEDGDSVDWLLMVIIPSNDFLSTIKTTMTQTIIFVVCICVTSVLVGIVLAWAITTPLVKLAKAMAEATQFDFSALSEGYLKERSVVYEIGRLQGVFNEMMVKFADAIRKNKTLLALGNGALGYAPTGSNRGRNSVAVPQPSQLEVKRTAMFSDSTSVQASEGGEPTTSIV
ncbi:hypothetical protein HDU96_010323 [Phlyctochytrium bullatum]|nr:hypothetical protein HDU96_010323 [Phlyctochytrium bullatum]